MVGWFMRIICKGLYMFDQSREQLRRIQIRPNLITYMWISLVLLYRQDTERKL